ncbi:hypothetical protein Tco_0752659 [Tanacetum coccineum]|uniref:Transposase (putative) gypsy type domain-containing protein n=1 Tax=Tanacetum coccineum TaxID=301880 RepID=A0ABQ4ZB19_9ASTR
MSDSEADLSNHSSSSTHQSSSPLNTIIPNEAELTTGGDGLILESVNRTKDDTEHHLDNVEYTTEVNSPLSEHSPILNTSILLLRMHVGLALLPVVHIVKPSLGVILTGAALVRSSLRGDMDLPVPFVLAWSLTTHSILNDAESCQDMMINLATPAVRDQQNRLSDYQVLKRSWFELGRRALAQIDILWRYEALNEDYGELYESHRSCQGVSDSTVETSVMVVPAVENEGVEVNLRTSESALGPKRTGSLRVVLVIPLEHLPKHLPKSFPTMFRCPSGYLRRHVPPVSYDHLLGPSSGLFFLQVRFVFLSFILFTFPLSLHHMAFRSQTVGDAVVPKFDMHVYTSVLTSDEVKSLVAEYAIPLDLDPYVPPSSLTMNRLLTDKIGIYDHNLDLSGVRVPFSTFLLSVIKHFRVHISQLVPLGLNWLTMFEIYYRSLEINPSVNLFRAFYKLNKHGHWFSFESGLRKGGQGKIFNEFCTSLKHWKDRFFLFDCRAIPDAMPLRHQDSSVADPAPTGVCAEDIRRLCENIIDLRLVHPAMLYAVGLTTIWKHVGHHLVFKDGKGTVATSMSQFLKFRMAGGVRVGKGTALAANEAIPQHTTPPLPFGTQIPEKSDHQKVVEYENERVLAAKRKAQAAKDRAVGKRAATEGTS